jgi:hypothetical protein
MAGFKRKQSARRLKVDRLRAEGLSYLQIATRLKVSVKTIKRDMAILDEEIRNEPQYSEDRLKLREEFNQIYREGCLRIKADMELIRGGSKILEETTRPLKKGEVKKIADPQELLEVGMDPTQLEITTKIFGPNWSALAQHHKVLLDWINSWAKLWGLMVERETQITKETEKQVRGVMYLPVECKTDEEWLKLAEGHKKGKVAGLLPSPEKNGKKE